MLINECHADLNIEDLCYLLPWHLALAIDDDNVIENEERARSKLIYSPVLRDE
jgi:hypothetical protein